MKDADLIRMANQIATAFRTYSEDEAISETHTHIKKFWDPRMRQQIRHYLAEGGSGLSPVAAAAIRQLKDPIDLPELKIV